MRPYILYNIGAFILCCSSNKLSESPLFTNQVKCQTNACFASHIPQIFFNKSSSSKSDEFRLNRRFNSDEFIRNFQKSNSVKQINGKAENYNLSKFLTQTIDNKSLKLIEKDLQNLFDGIKCYSTLGSNRKPEGAINSVIPEAVIKAFLNKYNLFLDKKFGNKSNYLIDVKEEVLSNSSSHFKNKTSRSIKNLSSEINLMVRDFVAGYKGNANYYALLKNNHSRILGQNNGDDEQPMKITGNKRGGKWAEWSYWSTCSVSCGRGRSVRWRRCVDPMRCPAEYTLQEIPCLLPDCPPFKLFGLIKG